MHANAIVTLAEAKRRLFEDGTASDSVIEAIVESATAMVEAYIGGPAKSRTITDARFSGNGKACIVLPWAPVTAITEIEIRSTVDDSVIETLSAATDWILKDSNTGEVQLTGSAFLEGTRNCLFTGAAGYASTSLEFAQIKEAAFAAIDDAYRRWNQRMGSVASRSFPDGSASYIPAASLPPLSRQLLDPYRKWGEVA